MLLPTILLAPIIFFHISLYEVIDELACNGVDSDGHEELLPNVKYTFDDDGSDTQLLYTFHLVQFDEFLY